MRPLTMEEFCEGAKPLCPDCGRGQVVVRTNRKKGTRFAGCTEWPGCEYAARLTRHPSDAVYGKVVQDGEGLDYYVVDEWDEREEPEPSDAPWYWDADR